MATQKTTPNDQSVAAFLNGVEDEKKRQDSLAIIELLQEVTGLEPAMWGTSIIGFGSYHYKYASGREGDSFLTGFAPRKQNLVVYIMPGFSAYQQQLESLGKFTTGKSCLYINKLADIDKAVLKSLVKASVRDMKKKYACRDS